MNRSKWRVSIGVLALFASAMVAVASQPTASAWNRFPCQWNRSTVEYHVVGNSSPTVNFAAAAIDWNSRTNQFTLRSSSDDARDFRARNADYGVTGWSGKVHEQGDTSDSPPCSSGIFLAKRSVSSVNNHYNASSAERRRGVAVHEFGHMIGLAHENLTQPGCSGGDRGYIAVMYFSDARFSGNCAVFVPTNDDLTGVAALY